MSASIYYQKKEKMREPPKFKPKPHALPWVTEAMLTGRRAPVAKVKA
jgi:hypothetical protein